MSLAYKWIVYVRWNQLKFIQRTTQEEMWQEIAIKKRKKKKYWTKKHMQKMHNKYI